MESSGAGAVIEPLLTIEREDLTGTLEFEARGVVTTIHAVAGEIMAAEGGSLGESLGRLLLRSQRLTEEHFGGVIRRMIDALVDDKVIRFGEVAVDYGFLTSDDLDLALTQQVREKVMGCIHRGTGAWRFYDVEPTPLSGHHVVRTRPTLVEATRQLSERRIEEILILDEHRFPDLVAPQRVVAAEFELSPGETALLGDLNGNSSLHFLLPKAGSIHVPPLIAALVLGGGVELRTSPSVSPVGDERPIPPSFVTLRRAPSKLESVESAVGVGRHGLPRLGDPETTGSTRGSLGLPSLHGSRASTSMVSTQRSADRRPTREALTPNPPEAQDRTRRAFDRLRADLEKRKPTGDRRRWPEPMDARERRLMAESAFYHGRVYLRAEEAERALPGLARAYELRPEEHEYELYMKWAQMLVNDTFKDDRRRAEMVDLAVSVIREDPWCELAFSILGHGAFHDGKEEAALRFFQRAAHLDPKRLDASRLSDLLASRRTEDPRMATKPDFRSRARGELHSMLDEIVPQPIAGASPGANGPLAAKKPAAKGSATLRPAPLVAPDSEAPNTPAPAPPPQTPYGGLAVSPPVPPPPSSQTGPRPPPVSPSPSVRPLPPPSHPPPRPLALPASASPPAPPASGRSSSLPPARTPPPSPWRIPNAGATQPLTPMPLAGFGPAAPAAPPPPPPAPRAIEPDANAAFSAPDVGTAPPRGKRIGMAIAMWLGALVATVAVFRFVASPSGAPPAPTPTVIAFTDAAPTASTVAAAEPTPAPTPTTADAPTSKSAPTETAAAKAPPQDPRPSTTATLRCPQRSYGHRIYVDGHIIGEGGPHDLTVPCGVHRVRIGSNGIDKTTTITCGGTLEL